MAESCLHSTRLDGLGIVVTGGSSGIGYATAIAAAALGAKVVVHYRSNQKGANAAVKQIKEMDGQAFSVQADIRKGTDRASLVETAWRQLGHVDAWVHNAGADVLTGKTAEASFADKLDLLWEVDVRGTTLLAREVAQRMAKQSERSHLPSMVFIGWDQAPAGMEGSPGQMFGPIKAAVMALSQSMAQTLTPNVRVNCVAPGWIKTAWGDLADEAWNRRAEQSSLLKRWGSADDVAATITFLCSPAAQFINAQTIEVNGGWNRIVR